MQIENQLIQISYETHLIYLVENENDILPFLKGKHAFVIFQLDDEKLKEIMSYLHEASSGIAVIVNNVPNSLIFFKNVYKHIQAGGGIVHNDEREILAIFRRGKWDLPKGKLDDGETIEECALREVEEETGARELYLENLICVTYHIYNLKKMVFKETYWYQMKTSNKFLFPQANEGIEAAIWRKYNELDQIFENTYDSIKYVLKKASLL